MKNLTIKYEIEFINYFNNKKYCQFSDKWKKHLRRLFPEIKDDSMVYCSKHENRFAKGDIDLRIRGNKKIISLKNGKNACVHRERFTWFYTALKDLGISNSTLNILTLYHFGESKVFGFQDNPLTKEEIVERYSPQILKANMELNTKKVLDMIIERTVILGRQEYRQPIDFFYYGNLEKGFLLSVDQIIKLIKSRREISSSWIHFGQLVYQPGGRSRENNDYLETTIRWPILGKLFYITKDEDDALTYNIDK